MSSLEKVLNVQLPSKCCTGVGKSFSKNVESYRKVIFTIF